MAGRRSDTRERIQQVALDLFVEQGYENTSLREIAERLEVTKAALYYHFKTKEEIVGSLFDDLAESLDKILDQARSDPGFTGEKMLHRLAGLIEGRFVRIWRFVQENQPALKKLEVGNPFADRMMALLKIMCGDEDDPEMVLKTRLAVMALVMGNNPEVLADDRRSEVALKVALDLAGAHGALRRAT